MRIVFAVEAGAQIGLGIDGVAPDGNDTTAGYRRMSCAGPACQPRYRAATGCRKRQGRIWTHTCEYQSGLAVARRTELAAELGVASRVVSRRLVSAGRVAA